MIPAEITVVGGGLAGCEAAWQLAEAGIPVLLRESKPEVMSPAHNTPLLAEIGRASCRERVCLVV